MCPLSMQPRPQEIDSLSSRQPAHHAGFVVRTSQPRSQLKWLEIPMRIVPIRWEESGADVPPHGMKDAGDATRSASIRPQNCDQRLTDVELTFLETSVRHALQSDWLCPATTQAEAGLSLTENATRWRESTTLELE